MGRLLCWLGWRKPEGPPRFVQIAMTGHIENSMTQSEWTALGLTESGEVWIRSNRDSKWVLFVEREPR